MIKTDEQYIKAIAELEFMERMTKNVIDEIANRGGYCDSYDIRPHLHPSYINHCMQIKQLREDTLRYAMTSRPELLSLHFAL